MMSRHRRTSTVITMLCLHSILCGRHGPLVSGAFSSRRTLNISTRSCFHVQVPAPGRSSRQTKNILSFDWSKRDSCCKKMQDTSTERYATSVTENKSDNNNIPKQYFLLKSEPSEYSVSDLEHDVREEWDGIRNYQARNYLRSMNVGDHAFFYHSKTSRPGIVGTMKIVRTALPD